MCGIYASLSITGHVLPNEVTRELLSRRGPDASGELHVVVQCSETDEGTEGARNVHLTCYSTVLSLRGLQTVSQPVRTSLSLSGTADDSFLSWNGEAWNVAGKAVFDNDSIQVFSLLHDALHSAHIQGTPAAQAVTDTLAIITGPYAFVYFDHYSETLFFGRDPLGRRSLLHKIDHEGNIILASISDSTKDAWQEVEADGIYFVGLQDYTSTLAQGRLPAPQLVPHVRAQHESDIMQLISGQNPNDTCRTSPIAYDAAQTVLSAQSTSVCQLETLLRRSLMLRVCNIPEHGEAMSSRELLQPRSKLAVLFSGGLDCTVLARLSHDMLDMNEPIDLLNVAFENPRVHGQHPDSSKEGFSPYALCPDRITGLASFAELRRVCPNRQWRFVAVNVPYHETLQHRQQVIDLIHPHNTEMDLSIALALYFAARGEGFVANEQGSDVPYATNARVLLSGLGADELFGGYSRHALAYDRRGFDGLLDELNLDIGRLGKRNLGRDDRVFSHWAKETRFPFLDEDLVKWATNAPVWQRCGFGEPESQSMSEEGGGHPLSSSQYLEPGKKVLRCLAWKLGMTGVAEEKKRAIQFGARTAKMEAGRTKGTQVLA